MFAATIILTASGRRLLIAPPSSVIATGELRVHCLDHVWRSSRGSPRRSRTLPVRPHRAPGGSEGARRCSLGSSLTSYVPVGSTCLRASHRCWDCCHRDPSSSCAPADESRHHVRTLWVRLTSQPLESPKAMMFEVTEAPRRSCKSRIRGSEKPAPERSGSSRSATASAVAPGLRRC